MDYGSVVLQVIAASSGPLSPSTISRLVAEVTSQPGVEAAGLVDTIPLSTSRTWAVPKPGEEGDDRKNIEVFVNIIDSRYVQAMQIPQRAGRLFTAEDNRERDRVVILNQTAANMLFPGQDPLGQDLEVYPSTAKVVGVVADVRHLSLERSAGPQMYLPYSQNGEFDSLDLVVRSSLPVASLAPSVGAAIQRVDPSLPVRTYQTLEQVVERSASPRRFTLLLLSAFAGSALLLAALGIYGVLSYAVVERTHEIGIRMALGETSGGVLRRVVTQTMMLAGLGVVLGAVASLLVGRSVASLLYGVEPTDPLTFLAMAMVLLSVSWLAGYLPALRASRIEVVEALRATT